MSVTQRARDFRARRKHRGNILDYEGAPVQVQRSIEQAPTQEPGFDDDYGLYSAPIEKTTSSWSSGLSGYLLFALVPAALVVALLYYWKPGFLVDGEGNFNFSRSLMIGGIIGILGILAKMFWL
jgi:hypothetical protein